MNVTNKDIVKAYFKEVLKVDPDGTSVRRLICKGCNPTDGDDISNRKLYNPLQANGNQNLALHVKSKHPDYIQKVIDHKAGGQISMDKFVSKKATAVFNWLNLIIEKNLPFNIVEDPLYRSAVKYDAISIKTLQKYAHTLVQLIERIIKTELDKHLSFGLVFDAWGENLLYFVSLFVVTPVADFNIAFTTMMDEESHDAVNVSAFMEDILQSYDKSIQDNVGFFTGDNCTVNKKIARDNSKPFVGCASHRFNLGVEKFLRSDSVARYYNKVASLMHELRTYKNTARLRTKTTLGPKRKNETRWTGAFEQFKRYEAWCSDPSFKLEDLFFVR